MKMPILKIMHHTACQHGTIQ